MTVIFYVEFLRPIIDQINANFNQVVPELCHFNPNASDANKIGDVLREKYLQNQPVTESNLRELGKMISDAFTSHATQRLVSLVRKFQDIYYFRFDYENDFSYMTISKGQKVMGEFLGL